MQSSRCLNRGFRSFASIGSVKNAISCMVFALFLFVAPSLRADVVYDVGTGSTSTVQITPMGIGNSFYTASSNTKLQTVSVYLYATSKYNATITVSIFNTTGTGSNRVTTGSSLASVTYSDSVVTSNSSANPTLVAFDFGGSNLRLTANTHYAFMTTTSSYYMYGFKTNTNPYDGVDNMIQGNYPSGSSAYPNAFSGKVEVTAVPEPGTLILTGSALSAGAIGVYFTRRHKDQALAPAAV